MIWTNDWDVRAAEAMVRITLQDHDAKVMHTPPNELDGVIEEDEEEEVDEIERLRNRAV